MSKIYFPASVDEAIIRYNAASGSQSRDRIYQYEIHKPLNKLVENVIHKYKFYQYENNYGDLKHETVVHLQERLYNYTQLKGKAFSYFTIVARNFLIAKSKEVKLTVSNMDDLEEIDNNRNIINEVVQDEYQGLIADFISEWSIWGIENVNLLFSKEKDRKIAEAVFTLFKNCKDIENFNKKALYISIREYADVKTQYITKVVNRLREMFKRMTPDYLKNGIVDWNKYLKIYIIIDQEDR